MIEAHQIVNGHALYTVMLRAIATGTVDKAMAESTGAEGSLIVLGGEKDNEVNLPSRQGDNSALLNFYNIHAVEISCQLHR